MTRVLKILCLGALVFLLIDVIATPATACNFVRTQFFSAPSCNYSFQQSFSYSPPQFIAYPLLLQFAIPSVTIQAQAPAVMQQQQLAPQPQVAPPPVQREAPPAPEPQALAAPALQFQPQVVVRQMAQLYSAPVLVPSFSFAPIRTFSPSYDFSFANSFSSNIVLQRQRQVQIIRERAVQIPVRQRIVVRDVNVQRVRRPVIVPPVRSSTRIVIRERG